MLKIEYDNDNQVIYLIKKNGIKEILENDFPSEPVISPDGSKAAYISPLEWECIGNLYMLDLNTGEKKTLLAPEDDLSVPKEVIWIDKENLAVILGFGMGTVAIGGNVFIYNIISNSLTEITRHDSHIQIVNMNLNNDRLYLEGIKYIDEEYVEFEKFEEFIKLPIS